MRRFPALSCLNSRVFGALALASLAACDNGPPPSFIPDGGMDSSTPMDGSTTMDGSLDAADGATDDADLGDGGPPVSCSFGSAMPLISSANQAGMVRVPFAAGANVGGVLVAAPIRSVDAYPNYERLAVMLTTEGVVTTPANLANTTTSMSTSGRTSVAPSGSGFITLFEAGSPSSIQVRKLNQVGESEGTATTLAASALGQTEGRIVRTASGFAAAWTESTETRLAVLDTNGAVVGSVSNPTPTIGTPNARTLYTIGGAPYLAYVNTSSRVASIAISSSGTVTGSPTTLTLQDGSTNFDVAGGAGSAAVVYEVLGNASATSIVFRAITSNGTASVAERTLTAIDDQGERPSIAPLAGGFLVLFRYNPAVGNDTLRLVTLSTAGETLATHDLIQSFPDDMRYTLTISPDGAIYVAFEEASMLTLDGGTMLNGSTLRAFRVLCE